MNQYENLANGALVVLISYMFAPLLFVILITMFFVLWGHNNLAFLSTRLIAWFFLKISGLKVIFENRSYAQEHQPCIFVGNHQDTTDVILSGNITTPNTVGVWKKSVADHNFLLRLFIRSTGSILMDPSDLRYSLQQFKLAKKKILVHKLNIWVFPEGGLSGAGERMGPFYVAPFRLAVKTGAPIVPFVISDLSKVLDIRKCRLKGGVIRIRYLPPVHVENQSSKELKIKVRKMMEEAIERLWQE